MAINGNFTQSFKASKPQKQKVTQKDLTSFQATSSPRLTKDTVSFGSKNSKHSDKITFAGVWKPGPKVNVSHSHYQRDSYGTSGSWSTPVIKQEESQQYHPYAWESEPTVSVVPDEAITNSQFGSNQISRGSTVTSSHPDFKAPNYGQPIYPIIGEALNREWSLYHKQEDLRLEGNKQIEKGNQVVEDGNSWIRSGNKEKENFSDFFTDKSQRFWDKGHEIHREADEIIQKGKELHKQREFMIGEQNELGNRRAKGEVVDISVRNKANPNSAFEDFLKKLNTGEHKAEKTVWNLIALPKETMKVADAILIALGHKKESIISLSDELKVPLIKGHDIKSSSFVRDVINGLPKVLK